jgi:diaminopimelate decarboxylase
MKKEIFLVTKNLRYKNNTLFFEEVKLEDIVKEYGTPVYVYSKNRIIENFTNYDLAFKNRQHLICYAMKANSNKTILKIIKNLGGGVDITSGGELYRALNAGVKPQKIVYAGVGKTEQEIVFAIKSKILIFNVESRDEVVLINSIAKKLNKKVFVAVRVNPEVVTGTHSHISTGEEGTKFGIPIDEMIDFAKFVLQNKNLNFCGLHFHIGSQITQTKPFLDATTKVVSLIPKLAQLGITIKYFDIGGGLGIRYKEETPPTPQELLDGLLKIIPKGLKIICEPGRYIVGNSGVLITKVLFTKPVRKKKFLIVDASMTDLIRPAFYDAYHNIQPLVYKTKNGCQDVEVYDIVGPVCETSDFLGKNRPLPKISNGEYLVIECAGAYGFAMSSNYNSRLKSAEVMVDKDKHFLIRKRENYPDLVEKEVK